ncbi:MAG: hypothetical protein A2Z29_00355 [Chloroflexi bacterium RBG_16_56_11]|nr:MAG: hypothetical protein A2Z29_00355 [Chloroflexi bacterium RBG_16_56_11]
MDSSQAGGTGSTSWLKKRLLPITGLVIVLAVIASLGYVYFRYPGILDRLEGYGYLGAFIISVILNATVIVPVSNMAVIISLGAALPSPVLVGLAGGLGAGIGEMTGYLAGRSSRSLLIRSNIYTRMEHWVKKWGWIAIFVLSIVPFAFDVVGIIAGALRMPIWRFFLACWLGRTISYVIVANLASISWPVLVALIAVVLAAMVYIGLKVRKKDV